jgi:hypothetical protein
MISTKKKNENHKQTSTSADIVRYNHTSNSSNNSRPRFFAFFSFFPFPSGTRGFFFPFTQTQPKKEEAERLIEVSPGELYTPGAYKRMQEEEEKNKTKNK